MKNLPLISIVVPSYNQGQFIGETLQSLVDQEYPKLQVVVQDGGSSDESIAIAEEFTRRYPEIFQLFVEKDSGQADAINRGFARAKGAILGFLNSDDTLYPRVLHRVAAEIDPAQGRYVVMGRSLFTGVNSRYVGVEHPAEYISHFEHLAIWRRGYNTIPQPSVFWHKDVTERVGWLDVNEHHALDYDLFCRFSRYYRFHRVDELFSNYRMHDESKSAQRTEAEVLELSIAVSRKHWGGWWSPLRWRLALSHWAYARHFHDHARHHARRAEEAFKQRRMRTAAVEFMNTFRYSPSMAKSRLLYGWLAGRGLKALSATVARDKSYHGQYTDGWIGPEYATELKIPAGARYVKLELEHAPQRGHEQFEVQLLLNGTVADHRLVDAAGRFSFLVNISVLEGQVVVLEIKSASYFVPRDVMQIEDDRELSLMIHGITFEPT